MVAPLEAERKDGSPTMTRYCQNSAIDFLPGTQI